MERKYRDSRPIHEQIAADLRAEILDGSLVDQLPTFGEMAKRFDASVNACQRGVDLLKSEGLVAGRQGMRLKVIPPTITPIEADAYFDPRGGKFSYEDLHVEEIEPPGDVVKALRVPAGGRSVMREMVTHLNGSAVELARNYYPLEIASGTALAGPGRIRGGAKTVLAAAGFPQRYMIDEISERVATSEEVVRLALPDYASVLRTFRVIFSDGDRPVEASVLVKSGHGFAVKYRMPLH